MEELYIDMIENFKEKTNKVLKVFMEELKKINIGRATPNILNGIKVICYNSIVPLNQLANIVVSDSNMLTVCPYDKKIIKDIEKAIIESNLGLNPNSDGEIIRIPISKLTEEKRKELVKKVKKISEDFKIQLRNIRRYVNDDIKKTKKNNVSEDNIINSQNEIQKITNDNMKKIEDILLKKEKSIMEI